MKTYSTVFFDLDGTLTDPAEGITKGVAYALRKFGLPVPGHRQLLKCIGPSLVYSFTEFFGLSQSQAEQGRDFFREYYKDRGMFENRVYEGIVPLLQRLKAAGKTLCLATAKAEPFAEGILEHFGLQGYFDFVAGATMDETRTHKNQIIAYALQKCGVTDRSQTVMIGDRYHDIEGAAENGIDSVGVLYGYGSREELAAATYLAATVAELSALLQE